MYARAKQNKSLSGIKKKGLGLDWVAAWDSPGMPVEGGFSLPRTVYNVYNVL